MFGPPNNAKRQRTSDSPGWGNTSKKIEIKQDEGAAEIAEKLDNSTISLERLQVKNLT